MNVHNRRFTWADALSLSRLPLAGAFMLAEATTSQAIIVAAAAFTDLIDGWLARQLGQSSRAGEIIDPVADKLFVLTILVTLVLRSQLRIWEVLLLLLRDSYNTFAFIVLRAQNAPVRFQARRSGKVVTVLQIGSVLALLIAPQAFHVLLILTAAAGVWAIVDYTRAGLRDLRQAHTAG